ILMDDDELARRRRVTLAHEGGAVLAPGALYLGLAGRTRERHEHALGVPLDDRHPRAGAGDRERRRLDRVADELAEDLAGLLLDLLLFLGDVRDDVVEDVERDDAGRAAGARDRLERGHEHALDAEMLVERRERDGEPDGGAVRVRRDETLPAATLALDVDELRLIEVDAGDENRHVVFVAERRRRRNHGGLGAPLGLELARRVALDRREDDAEAARVEGGG